MSHIWFVEYRIKRYGRWRKWRPNSAHLTKKGRTLMKSEQHTYLDSMECEAVFEKIRVMFNELNVVPQAKLRLSVTTQTMQALTRTNRYGVSLFELLCAFPNMRIAIVGTSPSDMHSMWLEVLR